VRALDGAAVETRGLALRRPSLDDVFMALTGHAAEDTGQQGRRRGRRRGAGKDMVRDSDRSGEQERVDENDTARAAS
jgi:ABC-2 type transport system ATP-binding protein